MSEYPLMMYRPGVCEDHMLWGEPLPIDGKSDIAHITVNDAEEEEIAASEGWSRTIADTNKPRRGRPPKTGIAIPVDDL